MATITKRGKSYAVQYRYTDANGETKQKWETFHTQKEAKERAGEIEAQMAQGTFIRPNSMTVRELCEMWLPIQCSKHKWSPHTYTGVKGLLQNLIYPYIGDIPLQQLRSYHLESLYKTLSVTPCGLYKDGVRQKLTEKQKKRMLSGTTAHKVHSLLRTIFSYAVEWELVAKSPVPRDGPKATVTERKIWDADTVNEALREMDDPLLHLAVHLAFVCSLRLGELLGLKPEDLDFDAADGRGTITVCRSLQRVSKDSLTKVDPALVLHTFPDRREYSGSVLILKSTKTEKSRRVLFMTAPLKEELRRWLALLAKQEAEDPAYDSCGLLFRLPNGDPVEQTLLRKWFEKWEKAHPEYESIVFHALRHASATYQLDISGGDYKSVQGNTGHSQTRTLLDIYAHTQDHNRLALAEKFERDFYRQDDTAQNTAAQTAPEALDETKLLEFFRKSSPEFKQQLRLALFT